jgi:hypothetical protein
MEPIYAWADRPVGTTYWRVHAIVQHAVLWSHPEPDNSRLLHPAWHFDVEVPRKVTAFHRLFVIFMHPTPMTPIQPVDPSLRNYAGLSSWPRLCRIQIEWKTGPLVVSVNYNIADPSTGWGVEIQRPPDWFCSDCSLYVRLDNARATAEVLEPRQHAPGLASWSHPGSPTDIFCFHGEPEGRAGFSLRPTEALVTAKLEPFEYRWVENIAVTGSPPSCTVGIESEAMYQRHAFFADLPAKFWTAESKSTTVQLLLPFLRAPKLASQGIHWPAPAFVACVSPSPYVRWSQLLPIPGTYTFCTIVPSISSSSSAASSNASSRGVWPLP